MRKAPLHDIKICRYYWEYIFFKFLNGIGVNWKRVNVIRDFQRMYQNMFEVCHWLSCHCYSSNNWIKGKCNQIYGQKVQWPKFPFSLPKLKAERKIIFITVISVFLSTFMIVLQWCLIVNRKKANHILDIVQERNISRFFKDRTVFNCVNWAFIIKPFSLNIICRIWNSK
jgi:hypothetical protein